LFIGAVNTSCSDKEFVIANEAIGFKQMKFQAQTIEESKAWASAFEKAAQIWILVCLFNQMIDLLII
jgi:hypothetical protein